MLISRYTGLCVKRVINERSIQTLGYIGDVSYKDMATYVNDTKYLRNISDNIKMIITTEEIYNMSEYREIGYVLVDNPKEYFFALHNSLKNNEEYVGKRKESYIDESAQIGKNVSIAPDNVYIGKNVIIEDFVKIYENTYIDDDCTICAGTKIGSIGFQNIMTRKGRIPILHYGGTHLKKGVVVHCNVCIDRALFPWDSTIIGENTQIDNMVHVAHGVKIGDNCSVAAGANICGRTLIEDEVWIGAGTIVSNGLHIKNKARLNIGSVIVNNCSENSEWSGNLAIPHTKYLVHHVKKLRGK